MCQTKNALTRQGLEIKVKIYKKYILKETRKRKAIRFHNFLSRK